MWGLVLEGEQVGMTGTPGLGLAVFEVVGVARTPCNACNARVTVPWYVAPLAPLTPQTRVCACGLCWVCRCVLGGLNLLSLLGTRELYALTVRQYRRMVRAGGV